MWGGGGGGGGDHSLPDEVVCSPPFASNDPGDGWFPVSIFVHHLSIFLRKSHTAGLF